MTRPTDAPTTDGLRVEPSPDDVLKARHRAVWASGDYASVAAEVIPTLGAALVEAAGVHAGQDVLDVAAGTGNASLPAARTGAHVTAADLTPELLDVGRALAEEQGLQLSWRTADVEHLPFDDASFDVVLSCVGVMFAPHHQAAADEVVRVCRPGGTLALVSWTPEGFVGRMFAAMTPFAPPPPPGAQPPPLWGEEAHVRDLLGDRVADVEVRREELAVTTFARPADFREFFKATYGPTIAVYRSLADDPGRTAELDDALDGLARDHGLTDDGGAMRWEYLRVVARRA